MNLKYKKFRILPYRLDLHTGQATLNYAFDKDIFFSEIIDFNKNLENMDKTNIDALKESLNYLSVIAGISYYKAYIPKHISIENTELPEQSIDFIYKTYFHGLGEFASRNDINLEEHLNFIYTKKDQPEPIKLDLPNKNAVLVGGGKDSITSIEIMKSSKEDIITFAVNPAKPISDTISKSDISHIFINRKLDSKLFKLNEQDAYNGHIPITAIISMLALCSGIIHGFDNIILSNERSANEGNKIHNDVTVNHQYSKSLDFELDFVNFIHQNITPSISYFSLLRPLSELHIARLFARNNKYDEIFTSCNSAFKINKDTNNKNRWCNNCPKCRFVFLILATAMNPDRLVKIFGHNLLNNETQINHYRELCGLTGHKPWECVGELKESSASIHYLSNNKDWKECLIIKKLLPEIEKNYKNTSNDWDNFLKPSKNHNLSDKYISILENYIE